MHLDSTGRKLPTKEFNGKPVPYDNLRRYIQTRRFECWSQIRAAFDSLPQPRWLFRGQSDARWPLRTTLERALERHDYYHEENYLISLFKSRAHHYLTSTPAHDNDLEWLALMQHHGAPTRLLDFTVSPYVALYFAIERVSTARCAVWAVNGPALQDRTEYLLSSIKEWHDLGLPDGFEEKPLDYWLQGTPAAFSSVFLNNQCSFVCPVQPSRVNERMVTQQGVFLCPGKSHYWDSFEMNLLSIVTLTNLPDYIEPAWNPPLIYHLTVPATLRAEILSELNRMNINRATLFPGLDGFAASLASALTVRRTDLSKKFGKGKNDNSPALPQPEPVAGSIPEKAGDEG